MSWYIWGSIIIVALLEILRLHHYSSHSLTILGIKGKSKFDEGILTNGRIRTKCRISMPVPRTHYAIISYWFSDKCQHSRSSFENDSIINGIIIDVLWAVEHVSEIFSIIYSISQTTFIVIDRSYKKIGIYIINFCDASIHAPRES